MSISNPNMWAAGVAQRLRVIQSSWAEEEESVRREYLRDEVARSIEKVPFSERAISLDALRRHFPKAVDAGPVAVAAPAAAVQSAAPVPASAAEACEQLVRLLKDASEEDKQSICKRLQASGLSIQSGAAPEESQDLLDLVPEMIRRLRLKPGSNINSSRVLRLLIHMLEAILSIDDLVWNLWRQVAPNSSVKRKGRGDLRQMVGAYLTNDPSVSFADVSASMELSRKVNTSLLGALGPLGRNFAKRHLQKFSPETIREAVDLEGGGGFLKAKAVQCWQKYEDLASDVDEQAITLQLHEILSSYAEELILGPKAWQHTRNPIQ